VRDELGILIHIRVREGGVVDDTVNILIFEVGNGLFDSHIKTTLPKNGPNSRFVGTAIEELVLGDSGEEGDGHVSATGGLGFGIPRRGGLGIMGGGGRSQRGLGGSRPRGHCKRQCETVLWCDGSCEELLIEVLKRGRTSM